MENNSKTGWNLFWKVEIFIFLVFILSFLILIYDNVSSIRKTQTKISTQTEIEINENKPLTLLKPVTADMTYDNTLKAKLTKNKNAFLCPFCETHLVIWASSGETAVARYECPNCGFTTFEAHVNTPDKDAAIAELDRLIIKYCTEDGESNLWD